MKNIKKKKIIFSFQQNNLIKPYVGTYNIKANELFTTVISFKIIFYPQANIQTNGY